MLYSHLFQAFLLFVIYGIQFLLLCSENVKINQKWIATLRSNTIEFQRRKKKVNITSNDVQNDAK